MHALLRPRTAPDEASSKQANFQVMGRQRFRAAAHHARMRIALRPRTSSRGPSAEAGAADLPTLPPPIAVAVLLPIAQFKFAGLLILHVRDPTCMAMKKNGQIYPCDYKLFLPPSSWSVSPSRGRWSGALTWPRHRHSESGVAIPRIARTARSRAPGADRHSAIARTRGESMPADRQTTRGVAQGRRSRCDATHTARCCARSSRVSPSIACI